jgi:GAF domain-containing protein
MQSTGQSVPQDNTRSLTFRYVIGLGLIALLLIAGQIIIQLSAAQQTADGTVVNLSGRQRMLSQKLSKAALESLVAGTETDRNAALTEVQEVIAQWGRAHRGLQFGDAELNLPVNTSAEVARLFAEIGPNFEAMYAAGNCLVPSTSPTLEGCNLGRTTYAQTILANEGTFLTGMDAITFQYAAEAEGRVSNARLIAVAVTATALALLAGIGYFLFRPLAIRIGQTIEHLTQSERELSRNLEKVAARSRDLQTMADVNTQIATILEPRRLLQDVADLTKERFELYHSHVYLVNEAGDTLQLTAGAGHVGREMVAQKRQIALENVQSIVATAGRDRKGVIINDTRASATFLPHPLLPNTRSELAVPLVARGQLLGVLDVQSDQPGYFTEDVLEVFQVMASQIATAISNARLYDLAERTSRHDRAITEIDRHIQGALGVDEIIQTTVKELGKALRVPYTAIELKLPKSNGEHADAAKEN